MTDTVERLIVNVSLKGIGGALTDLAALEVALSKLDQDKINVPVEVKGTGKALAELESIDKKADEVDRNRPVVKTRVDNETKKVPGFLDGMVAKLKSFGNVGKLVKPIIGGLGISAAFSAVPIAAQAINGLGAAIFSLGASLGPVLSSLAALPSLISPLIQIGVVGSAALSGIGEAVSAGTAANASGGAGGLSAEERQRIQEDAAARVEAANRNLAAAEQFVADAQEFSAEGQQRLAEARQAAADATEEYRLTLDRLNLSERQGQAAVDDARRLLVAVNADPGATERDKRDAVLALADAEQTLAEIRADRDATEDALGQRATVEGSPEVLAALAQNEAARQSVEDALANQAAAERELQRATEDQATALAGGTGAVAATAAYNDALSELGPNAQALVRGLVALDEPLKRIKKNIQEAFAPGALKGVEGFATLLPILEKNSIATALALGNVVAMFGKLFQTKGFQSDLDFLGQENVKIIDLFGMAIFDVAQGLVHLMVAAAPFTEWVAEDIIGKAARSFREWAEEGRRDGSINDMFEHGAHWLKIWGGFLQSIGSWLKTLGAGSLPLAEWLLVSLTDLTDKNNEWLQSAEGQNRMAQFFKDMREPISTLGQMISGLVKGFISFSDSDTFSKFVDQLGQDLLPVLGEIMGNLEDQDFITSFVDGIVQIAEVFAELSESGALKLLLDFFVGFMEFGNWLLDTPVGKMIIDIGGGLLIAKVGAAALGVAVGFLATKFAALALAFSTNPIGLLVTLIVVALWLLYKNWDEVILGIGVLWDWLKEKLLAVWGFIKGLFTDFDGTMEGLGQSVSLQIAKIVKFFQEMAPMVWEKLKDFTAWLWKRMEPAWDWFIDQLSARVQWIVDGFKALPGKIWTVMKALPGFLWNLGKAGFELYINNHVMVLGLLIDFFKMLPGKLWDGIKFIGSFLWNLARPQLESFRDNIGDKVDDIRDFFTSLPGRIWNGMGDIGRWLWTQASAGLGFFRDRASGMANSAVDAFASIPGMLGDLANDLWRAGRDLGSEIVGGVLDGIGELSSTTTGLARDFADGIRRMINTQVIDRVNTSLEFDVSTPFGSFTVDPPDIRHLPAFARGGVVDEPTIGLIGEAGKEVILPLTDPRRTMELAASSGLFDVLANASHGQSVETTNNNIPVNITMNGVGNISPEDVAHETWWAIRSGVA